MQFEITATKYSNSIQVQSNDDNQEIFTYFQLKNQDSILPIAINLRRFQKEYYSVDGSRWTRATFYNWNDDSKEGFYSTKNSTQMIVLTCK